MANRKVERRMGGSGSFRLLSGLAAMLALCTAAAAPVVYVSPDGDDANNGQIGDSGATNFVATIQQGLTLADRDGVVYLMPGVYMLSQTVRFGDGKRSLVALSDNPADTVIDGGGSVRCIQGPAAARICLYGLTIQNGYVDSGDPCGAGVYSNANGAGNVVSNCVVRNCRIESGNSTANILGGGGVYMHNPVVVDTLIEDCSATSTFEGHPKAILGGGIYATSAAMTNCTVRNCSLSGDPGNYKSPCRGGGAYLSGTSSASNCTFEGCRVENTGVNAYATGGGAVIAGNGTIIENCQFLNNYSANVGGALVTKDGNAFASAVSIRSSLFSGNEAAGSAGGIYFCNGEIRDTEISGNKAGKCGAGLMGECNWECNIAIDGCLIDGNESGGMGAAATFVNCNNATFTNTRIVNNRSPADPVYTTNPGVVGLIKITGDYFIGNCIFSGNAAPQEPLLSTSGKDSGVQNCHIRNTLFARNESQALACYYSTAEGASGLRVENCTFAENVITQNSDVFTSFIFNKDKPSYFSMCNCALWRNVRASDPTKPVCFDMSKNVAAPHTFCDGFFNAAHAAAFLALSESNVVSDASPFADAANGDWRPAGRSPLKNAGAELSWHAGTVDLLGVDRVVGTAPDIGAYELNIVNGMAIFVY